MIKKVNRRAIVLKLAKKYDLSMKDVDLIISSQFSLVREVMCKGEFESVRLPYFGLFWVKPGRKEHIDISVKKKQESAEK